MGGAAVGIIMGSSSDWDTMRHAADVLDHSQAFFAPIAAVVLWMGVYPQPFLSFFEASVTALIAHDGEAQALAAEVADLTRRIEDADERGTVRLPRGQPAQHGPDPSTAVSATGQRHQDPGRPADRDRRRPESLGDRRRGPLRAAAGVHPRRRRVLRSRARRRAP